MWTDLGQLQKAAELLERELSGKAVHDRLKMVGHTLQREVEPAVRRSIGDNSMSGWRRNKPIPVTGASIVISEHEVVILPDKPARGPMRVLEEGRKAYAAGDRRASGFRVRKKDGLRVQKTRKVKRNVGATRGKGTWTDAEQKITEKAPQTVRVVVVQYALKESFGKV